MKTLLIMLATVSLFGCGEFIQVEKLPEQKEKDPIVTTQPVGQPINVTVVVEGSTNIANGGSGGSSSATGGSSSNTNDITSGNNSATGGSGNGGNGGSSSAGNSTANNSSSSNSTNNSTNSGSASNQANNSNSNSSNSSVSGSGNSTNTNTQSVEVNQVIDFDFNILLGWGEDYFDLAWYDTTPRPRECRDPHPNLNLLCHAYDFTGRNSLTNQLDNAPHLGSFYMDKFDVTPRSWDQGFPKFPANLAHLREYYAVRCFARLDVKTAGQHTFSITSDDGMRVILNGSPVLEDDGLHAPRVKSGTVNLVRGLYEMEVQWFQGPKTQIAAELKWATPGNSNLRYIEPADMVKTKRLCE